jgi:hypothetical protein
MNLQQCTERLFGTQGMHAHSAFLLHSQLNLRLHLPTQG